MRAPVGDQLASSFTCASLTFLPSQLRSTLSSTMRIDTGSREIAADARLLERGQRIEAAGAAGGELEFPKGVVQVVRHV